MNFLDLKKKYEQGHISKSEFILKALSCHNVLFDYVSVLQTTDVKEICIQRDGVSFVIGDEDILIHSPSGETRVAPLEIMNFNHYEPQETMIMDLLSAGAKTILDIGANIGWYSIRFAKRLPNAKIFSFEPLPNSYEYLQRNVSANLVGDRVRTFNYGLSDSNGAIEFYISPSSGTNASLKNVASSDEAFSVLGFTLQLDQWVLNQNVVPDFIKCDVEGAELLVFRGGRQTILQHKPVIFSELLRKWSKPFGYHPNEVLSFFDELGYICFAIGIDGASLLTEVTEDTVETNYAFLHRDAHTSLISTLKYSR